MVQNSVISPIEKLVDMAIDGEFGENNVELGVYAYASVVSLKAELDFFRNFALQIEGIESAISDILKDEATEIPQDVMSLIKKSIDEKIEDLLSGDKERADKWTPKNTKLRPYSGFSTSKQTPLSAEEVDGDL